MGHQRNTLIGRLHRVARRVTATAGATLSSAQQPNAVIRAAHAALNAPPGVNMNNGVATSDGLG